MVTDEGARLGLGAHSAVSSLLALLLHNQVTSSFCISCWNRVMDNLLILFAKRSPSGAQ